MAHRSFQRVAAFAVLAWLGMSPVWPADSTEIPIWTPHSKLTVADGVAGDQLGTSVAVSGDVAVVGAPFAGPTSDHQGASYVFARSGDTWVEQTKLAAGDGTEGDHRYGWSVAIDGDTLLIGAPGATNADNTSAAYVYTRSGDTWTQQAKLTASDGSWEDDFGSAVALDGDTALVGAKQAVVDGTLFRGAVYVFTRDGDTWSEQQKLVPADEGRQFGWSLALDGLTALVGASFTNVDGVFMLGAAYVFVRAGANWTEQAKLIADDGEEGDQFGAAVALQGATAMVGAPEKRIAGKFNQGAVYHFERDGATWSRQARLIAADGETGDRFGITLALDGDRLLAGAHTGGFREGAAYVLARDGDAWEERAKLTATDGTAQNDFGRSVALDADTVLVGSPRAEVDGGGSPGAAYAFADVDAGRLTFTPDPLDFGSVVVGVTGPTMSVTLTNTGTVDATVTGITTPDAPFTAAGGSCGEPPFPAAPGASCTFDFSFTPAAEGDFSAVVEVASDTPFSPDTFELVGRGVSPQPDIAVEPGSLTTLLYVDGTATETLTLGNPGLADLEWQVIVDDAPEIAAGRRRPVRLATPVDTVGDPARVTRDRLVTSGVAGERSSAATRSGGEPAGEGVVLSHSTSDDIVPGTVACGIPGTPYTYPTQFLRTFTLPDFGIDGDFQISEVSFGVETLVIDDPAVETVDVTVSLYALDGEFTYANLTPLASRTVALEPQQGTVQTVPLGAVAPAGGTLVMEVAAPLLDHTGRFFAGSNPDGETAPSYLAASACGSDDPVTYGSIGEPDVHLVMSVTGTPRDCTLPGWLSAAPTAGTLAPGAEEPVSVTFDATGLAAGFYPAELCIAGNDQDPARTVVPVLLAVTENLQEAKLTAGDGAQFNGFGAAVAVDGDTALIGAPRATVDGDTQRGAVYVFTRDGDGWSEQAKLVASDGGLLGQFGSSIALQGDTALIGAMGTNVDGNMFQGAAYVFTRTDDTWSEQVRLVADDGAAFANFGDAVALDGDTALIGTPAADVDGNVDQGAAYVFSRDGDTWSHRAKLIAADGGGNDQFGDSVALDGDTALVGADNAVVDGDTAHGAAYVFTRTEGSWSEATKLTASDGTEFDRFGAAVALGDGTALVGGNGATVNGNVAQGAVWVFAGGGDVWSEQTKLTAADGAGSDNFGAAVALDGATAVVGAEFADVGDNGNQGAAYVYRRQGETWASDVKLVADDGAASDTLGAAAALDGSTALIGAPGAAVDGNNGQGAAYVFALGEELPELTFDPSSLAFGDVEVGSTSPPQITNLHNAGSGTATELAFSTPGGGFDADLSACGASLPPGASCQVSVTFTPAAPGTADAELEAASAEGATALLALSGNGVIAQNPPTLDVDPDTLSSTLPPDGTETQPLTLANLGDATLDWEVTEDPDLFVVDRVVPGYEHACAVTPGGDLYCWGKNWDGQLGIGTADQDPHLLPAPVVDPDDPEQPFDDVVRVDGGAAHTCALTTEGTVLCWGFNGAGRLGTGDEKSSPVPRYVVESEAGGAPLTGVDDISVGDLHTCAHMTDSTARCWGYNFWGQLGNQSTVSSSVPVPVVDPGDTTQPLSGLQQVVAGNNHTCARDAEGGAYCWGWNIAGQVGNGTTTPGPTSVPTAVVDPESPSQPFAGVTHITAGNIHTCATTDEDRTYCWGQNAHGQLGNDDAPNNSSVPSLVVDPDDPAAPLTGVARVTAGGLHVCAVTIDSRGYCWGANENGQLGNGANEDSAVPVPIADPLEPTGAFSGLGDLAPRQFQTCATTEGGIAYCWGRNNHGQLGDGTMEDRALAAPVDPGVAGDCTLPTWLAAAPPNGSIPGGGEQTVDVSFDAGGLEPGDFSADLCLASNDPAAPLVGVPITLVVTDGGVAELTFEPSSLEFGDVEVDTTSPLLTATLSNTGDVDLTGLAFTTPGGGFDADTGACGTTLGVGQSCPIDVTFTPTELGPAAATLTATSDQEATADLALTGQGTEGPGPGVQKLIASDGGTDGFFGRAVDVDGDIAVIGAAGDADGNFSQGAAYVFTRSDGVWSEQARLVASDAAPFASFGNAVALDGDTVVIGAITAIVDGDVNRGAAYVFVRDGDTWVEQAKLIASDGASTDNFGSSVALDGDVILIGAHAADVDGNSNQGAAYVFTRSGDAWEEQAKLTASDGALLDNFGSAVALRGDTALIGAGFANIGGNFSQGAVYVFGQGEGGWSEQDKLTASDGAENLGFGISLALSGSTVLVGAPGDQVDGVFRGAAYVLVRSGDDWLEQAKLTASDDGTDGVEFGADVAIDGDIALVGAPWTAVGDNAVQGAAWVFTRDGTSWSRDLKLTAADGRTDDFLGGSVALADDAALAGAWLADVDGNNGQGAVYVFDLGAGEGAPELAFDPASLDFGDVEVGTSSEPRTATLTNTGDADATGLVFSAPGGGFEADTADCGFLLAPGEGCDVVVTFTPPTLGPASAELQADTQEGATALLALAGNGVEDTDPEQSFAPVALAVDPPGLTPEANGLFEPGESVDVAPAWRNDGKLAASLGGTASSFTGPEGAAYGIDLDAADYGLIEPGETASCFDTEVCYRLGLDDPPARPAAHWDATFDETLDDTGGTTRTWTLHVGESFGDVPTTNPFYPAIETLLHSGITGGCVTGAEAAGLRPGRGPDLTAGTDGRHGGRPLQGGAAYCPGGANSRAQMPVFVLRALMGSDYTPPPCVEGNDPFGDVPFDSTFCRWIQDLAGRGIVSGCGDGDYCPGNPVTRAQMAIFLLKTLEGAGYEPPTCTNRFTDVPCPSLFADWIEDLAARGITGGCSETEYCPADPVTRAQMAVFVTRTFGFTLYGP